MTKRFYRNDLNDGRLRIRLTPDGRDVWTFNARLSLMFADGVVENYGWTGLRLDNSTAEITQPLSSARVP